ncbi:MAG: CAAX prenyl protease-related protein, partial [Acidobacteriota bacterium]
ARLTSIPYVVPFVVFVAFMGLRSMLNLSALTEQIVWFTIMAAVIAIIARPALDFRVRQWAGTMAMGLGVFVLWVAPDLLFPGYRGHWLLSNSITGAVAAGLPESERNNTAVLILRGLRASLIVPIVEELFWRAWLMRWLISPAFAKIPLGTYATQAFWIVAIAFAAEHGPYWDVGLLTGILYNWWMVRTKSLGDLILAHGITNACLSLYVVMAGKWEYWG